MKGIIGIFVLAVCVLFVGALFIGVSMKENKLVRLFPVWVVAYCFSFLALVPLVWYGCWEGPGYLIFIIFIVVFLVLVSLIVTPFFLALNYRRYGTAVGIAIMIVLLFFYTAVALTCLGMCEGQGDNFGKRHPIPENMEHYTFGEDKHSYYIL